MNVASLKLCKELYELSGWDNTELYHAQSIFDEPVELSRYRTQKDLDDEQGTGKLLVWSYSGVEIGSFKWTIPAYDLGYLLRKLPAWFRNGEFYLSNDGAEKLGWTAGYMKEDNDGYLYWTMSELADTPEDAACKLAIELFKQGVLTK